MEINPRYIEVTVALTSQKTNYHITADRNRNLDINACLWGVIRWSKSDRLPKGHLVLFARPKAYLVQHKEDYAGGTPYWDRYLVPINAVLALDKKLKPGDY